MRFAFISLWLLLVACRQGQAQEIIALRKITDLLLVGKQVYFLEDKSNKLNIQDILKQDHTSKFQLNKKDVFARSATRSAYWFKIVMQNHSNEDAWLEMSSLFAWHLDFYAPDSLNRYEKSLKMGVLLPDAYKLHNVYPFWFPLNKAGDRNARAYYLRVSTERTMEAPLQVGTLRALYLNKSINDYIVAGFLGIVLIMFLYNLFVYVSVWDKLYLFYVIFLFCIFFTLPFANNYPFIDGLQFGLIDKSWWHTHLFVWQAGSYLMISVFSLQYLRLYERLRWAYWLVGALACVLGFIIPVLRLCGIPHIYFGVLHQYTLITNSLIVVFLSYYLLYKGYKEVWYYSLGWTFLIASLIIYLMTINGIVPYTPYFRNSLYIGTSLEIWFFSLALGNRFNLMAKEKEKVQMLVIQKSRENERLVKEQRKTLEQKVQERTQEIELAYKEMQVLNEQLQAQQEEMRQNTEYLTEANNNLELTLEKLEQTQDSLMLRNQEFRAKEAQLRRVINSVPSHLYEAELDLQTSEMHTLLSSRAAEKLYDIPEAEMCENSRRVLKAIHPEDLPTFLKVFEKIVQTRTLQEITYRVIHKNGDIRWLHGIMLPSEGEAGKLLLTGIVNDITEQKEAERLIVYKGELLSAIASATDRLMKIDDWVEALSHIFRLIGSAVGVDRAYYFQNSTDETTGKHYMSQKITWTYHDDSIKRDSPTYQNIPFEALGNFCEELVQKRLFEGITTQMLDSPFKQGLVNLDVKSILILPIFVHDGFYGFIGFDDCTNERVWLSEEIAILLSLTANTATAIERFLADQALQASEKKLKRNLDELQNTQNQLIESEKMAVLGQLIAGVAHEINNPLGAIKASGNHIKNVLEHYLPALPAVFEKMSIESHADFVRLIAVCAGKESTLSAREDRRLRREWRDFLSDSGRNFKDTDTLCENLVEMGLSVAQYQNFQHLLDSPDIEELAKTLMRLVELLKSTQIINTAVERASKIVFALKKFSHSDSSDIPSSTSVQETIETVLTLYNNQIKRGINLQVNFEDVPPILGFADELSQVWTNLIYNAMQAMDFKGELHINLERVGEEAMVSIRDTGGGIPPEVKERMFEAFFTTKPAGEGTGLGLSITKKIIDKHNGRIELESEVGAGTTFKIFLPIPSQN